MNYIEAEPVIELAELPRKHARWRQTSGFDIDDNATFECSACYGGDVHAKGARGSVLLALRC